MGVEHLVTAMNKDTERGYLAHAHSLRLLTRFGDWPTKALESSPLKLPTLRVLKLASIIHGLAMDNLLPLHIENLYCDRPTCRLAGHKNHPHGK